MSKHTPTILQALHTDEFGPVALTPRDHRSIQRVADAGANAAQALRVTEPEWARSRLGTAAGLRALNAEHGAEFYRVPIEADTDKDAAAEAFDGGSPVIDVQSHFISQRPTNDPTHDLITGNRTRFGPDWWAQGPTRYWMDEYFRCLYVESETAVAVLTSAPGTDGHTFLSNEEMAATRELGDRLGGMGRLLNHTVVHPTEPGQLEAMDGWRERFQTVGWKVYTIGAYKDVGKAEWNSDEASWQLDDEGTGIPFLERVMDVGPRLVCAHKGLSHLAPAGSPRDIGPAARAFPDIDFLVYHSGLETPLESAYREGPYSDDVADEGVNRLVTTLQRAGVAPGSNVYAELGTSWFLLIKRPLEAAHFLGKLLLAVGEDNVVWGTDSIWYGSTQPLIDAFRAFQIPPELCDRYGYPEMTPAIKEKILCHNACRVYGIDIGAARQFAADDDVEWARQMMREYQSNGVPTLA